MCYFDGDIKDLGEVPNDILLPLINKVKKIGVEWDLENDKKPNKFKCFDTTRHIVFKYPVDLDSHLESTYKPIWKRWRGTVQPIIKHIARSYGYRKGKTCRIMLANIVPNGEIGLHIDGNKSADIPHKIHVPVFTNPSVKFYEGENDYYLERGRAYEVNNKILHGVKNNSDQERIHLIFDYYDAS